MVRRCVKKSSGQEYAAKIINTKKLSARGMVTPCTLTHSYLHVCFFVMNIGKWSFIIDELKFLEILLRSSS